MGHPFEIAKDLEVDATPEQVWDAIATGAGLDSWFMGRNEVEPREGGRAFWSIGGFTAGSTVTTWDPPTRFVNRSNEAPDGSFHEFDYRVEDRGSGHSAIRYVHSGMLGGDWEAEYEGMSEGDPMYLHKLVEYLAHFQGRYAIGIDVQGPQVATRELATAGFRRALGLGDEVSVDEDVKLTPQGMTPIQGVVDYLSPSFLGVRSSDALYRFIYGFDGTMMVGHHLFSETADLKAEEAAWSSWLAITFGPESASGDVVSG